MTTKSILLIVLTIGSAYSVGNPGILIQIPFPINIPTLPLALPLPIDNIVISNLQLSNIYLRELDYQWKFGIKNAPVNISYARISFDWVYKKDKGVGFFTEDQLGLQIFYIFTQSHSNHFDINITSSKIHPGHSHVSLGGGASQIVVVEVTNLILNHASLLFRGFINTQISHVINGFTSIIGEDKKIYTDQQTGKQYYINASLVAAPLVTGSDRLIVQINGAPYAKGTSSGSLNPEQILVVTSSPKIQVQIHKKIATSMIALLLKDKGGQFGYTLHTMEISSIIDVNSLVMCSIFPQMVQFEDARDVIFQMKASAIDFSFQQQKIKLNIDLHTNVVTHNTIAKRDELYISRADGKVSVELIPIFGPKRCSIRLGTVKVVDFKPNQTDIDSGRFRPEGIVKYFDFLTGWLGDAINLVLNRKVITAHYQNILAVLQGKVLKEYAYLLEVDLFEI